MKDIEELALRVAEAAGVKGFHWDGSLFDFVEPFLAAYLAEQEPVAQIDEFGVFKDLTDDYLPEGTKLYAAPPEPAPQQQKPQTTIGDSADPAQPTAVCAAPSSEEVREMAKYLYSIDEHIAADMIERLAARVHEQRIATLEQQNAELVTALKAIKGRVCGEAMPNWENTPNTGYSRGLIADEVDIALSKVKQP